MFIPQVARRIILNCSQVGDTICDIFCGSGTTLVESRLLGRNAYGIELNPLAVLIAKVKTTPINPNKLQKYFVSLLADYDNCEIEKEDIPNFFNINFWFKEKVINELALIKKCINRVRDRDVKDFFLVSFSETVRAASNTRSGEFKLFRISHEKLKDYDPNVLLIFKRRTENNIGRMADYYNEVNNKGWTKIILGDSTKKYAISDNSIDCIITSPPYGDSRTTVAYGQFSRLSLQWLDLIKDGDLQIDRKLMGGTIHPGIENNLNSKSLSKCLNLIVEHDSKRAKEVLAFYIDLNKAMLQTYRILKKYKYFCLVVGNRTVKGVKLPTDYIVAELGNNLGFHTVDIMVRNIPNKHTIDLEIIDRQRFEIAERRQPAAKIVKRKAAAQQAQAPHEALRAGQIGNDRGFRDLETDPGRNDSVRRQLVGNIQVEGGAAERHAGQVDRIGLPAPGTIADVLRRDVLEHRLHHPAVDLRHHVVAFGR